MINVTIDCERMKYPYSGLAHFCKNLVNEIILQSSSEINYKLFLPKNLEGSFGNNVKYLSVSPLHKIFIPTNDCNVWHSTSQVKNYSPLSKNLKKVLTIHDLNFLIEKKNPVKIKKLLHQLQQRINGADELCFISKFALDQCLENLDLQNKPTQVIYNGSNSQIPKELQPPRYINSKPFIFSIGTVLEKKNFHVLPGAIVNLDAELIIAGEISSNGYKNQIVAEAHKHGVANRVKIIGPISENDKFWYYQNCLAFAFPSLAEGFGLPPVEAMRFGKPVFLSNRTSLPEIGGDAAYYFNTFDPEDMQNVFTNGLNQFNITDKYQQIIEQSKKFDWGKAASKYIEIYKRLAELK